MALTSTTGTVDGSDVTFSLANIQGAGRGDGVSAYIDYTKAGADSITLQISYNDSKLGTTFYKQGVLNGSDEIVAKTIGLPSSGQFRFPLSMSKNDDTVKVSVAGLDTGALNFEFAADNPHG